MNNKNILQKEDKERKIQDHLIKMQKEQGNKGPKGMGRGMKSIEKAKNPKETLTKIIRYLRPYWFPLCIVLAFTFIQTLIAGFIPKIFMTVIDEHLGNNEQMLNYAYLLIVISFVYGCSMYLKNILMLKMGQNVVENMRLDAFNKLQTLPVEYFDQNPSGATVSRITNDIDTVANAITDGFVEAITSVLGIISSVIFLLVVVPFVLSAPVIIMVPIIFLIMGKMMKSMYKNFSVQQRQIASLNSLVEESIYGLDAVKLFSQEDNVLEEFEDKNKKLRDAAFKANFTGGLVGPIVTVFNNIIYVLIFILGAILLINNVEVFTINIFVIPSIILILFIVGYLLKQKFKIKIINLLLVIILVIINVTILITLDIDFTINNYITVGAIAAATTYAASLMQPVRNMGQLFGKISSALAGGERVFSLIEQTSEYENDGVVKIDKIKGDIVFDKVNFSYDGINMILKNISFNVKAGETIAIVGPTGSGKTTIINLLSKFYELDSGKINIDGISIKDIDKKYLRKKVGVVLQDNYLMHDTVYENIKYGKDDATLNDVISVAKEANADGFISRLPKGYETQIASGGDNFSLGERQLISIARTLIIDPDLLILDEATSSVDTKTEKNIIDAMDKLSEGRTTFVIAHRLQTIRNADKIIVLKDGEIKEFGHHDDLIEDKGIYYNLYTTQFSE